MGLLRRFFLSNIILLLSVVLVMTGVSFFVLQASVEDHALSKMEFLAANKAQEIEKFFSEKKLVIDLLGETEKIKRFTSQQDAKGLEKAVENYLSKSESVDVLILDPAGKVLFAHQGYFDKGENVFNDKEQTKLAEIVIWSRSQLEPKPLLLDFSRNNRFEQKEVMFLARPVVSDGQNLATVVLVYSIDQLERFVKRELSRNIEKLGPSAIISVYGEDSYLRASSSELSNFLTSVGEQGVREMERVSKVTRLQESDDGDAYFKSLTKAYLPDGLVWYVEVSVKENDIFRSLYHMLAGFLTVMLTVVLLVTLVSYYSSFKIIRPLYDVIDSIRTLGTTEKPEKLEVVDAYELGHLVQNYNELVDRLAWAQFSKEYFEGILQSIHEFVFIVERDENSKEGPRFSIKQVNKSVCESFHLGRYDLVGSDLQAILNLGNTDFDTFMLGDAESSVEGVLSVEKISLPVTVKPSQVKMIGERSFVVLCTDISQQKMQEEILIRAKEEAVRASNAKSEFLAKMSHEIRTPLNVIVGVSDILKVSNDVPEDKRHMVGILSSASENLLGLINDILDISKIEAQEIKVESIPTDVAGILNEVVSMMRSKTDPKGVELEFKNNMLDMPLVYLDPTRLRQIVVNLVGNAVKFTEQGKISVRLSTTDSADNAKKIKIEVQDTGIGIATEHQNSLFKSFVQADGTISRKFGGTGLGLAISRSLVELLEGRIWLNSELGKGTTFTFELPLRPVSVADQKKHAPAGKDLPVLKLVPNSNSEDSHHSEGRIRVLIADDTEDNRVLLKAYLKGQPVEIVEAENGQEVVDLVKTGQIFDLILIDIQMPVLDGYQATQEIRRFEKEHKLTRTPILALSANAMIEDFEKSKKMECDAHLTKPIRKSEVINAIAKYAA